MNDSIEHLDINPEESSWMKPSKDLVRAYASQWRSDEGSADGYFLDAFAIDFRKIRREEAALNKLAGRVREDPKSEDLLVAFVTTLDSIYGTRLKSPVNTAYSLFSAVHDGGLIERIRQVSKGSSRKERAQIIDKIATIDKKDDESNNYAYSFATKFCSRFAPDAFPIFDSFAAGLLYHYLGKNMKRGWRASLGSYEMYLSVYDGLIEQYGLGDSSYREIDYFLWTYGKQLKQAVDAWNKNNPASKQKSPYDLGAGIQYKALGQ